MRMREYKLAKKLFFIFSAKMYFAVLQYIFAIFFVLILTGNKRVVS
jgi:hypothetical protein